MDPERTWQQDYAQLLIAKEAKEEPFNQMSDLSLKVLAMGNEVAREEAAKIRANKAPELENPTDL